MMIETKNLTKEYKVGTQKIKALKGINLHVEKGEFISIMGPSGSGKTTLMNIIGCLDSPSNGTYMLNNRSSKLWTKLWCRGNRIIRHYSKYNWYC